MLLWFRTSWPLLTSGWCWGAWTREWARSTVDWGRGTTGHTCMPYRTWRLGECASATGTLAGKRGGGYWGGGGYSPYGKKLRGGIFCDKSIEFAKNSIIFKQSASPNNYPKLTDFHAFFSTFWILNSDFADVIFLELDSTNTYRKKEEDLPKFCSCEQLPTRKSYILVFFPYWRLQIVDIPWKKEKWNTIFL